MAEMFGERLVTAVRGTGSCAVVGLDLHLDRLPAHLLERYQGRTGADFRKEAALAVVAFNRLVIESIRGVVPAVKPQFAFYEALGFRATGEMEEDELVMSLPL